MHAAVSHAGHTNKRMRVLQLRRGDPAQSLSSIGHVSWKSTAYVRLPTVSSIWRTSTGERLQGRGKRKGGTPPSGLGKGTSVASRSRRAESAAIGSTSTVDCWWCRTPLKQAMRVGAHLLRVANGSGPVRILHVVAQVSNSLCKAPTQKSHLD